MLYEKLVEILVTASNLKDVFNSLIKSIVPRDVLGEKAPKINEIVHTIIRFYCEIDEIRETTIKTTETERTNFIAKYH